MKLVSIDLESNCGFFKNPQFNGEINAKHYSFDSIHKPAILGILGSLIGLRGIRKYDYDTEYNIPEYYTKLKHIPIGISIKNPIKKEWEVINSSSGMFSKELGGNLNLNYHLLVNPKYTIYLLLDTNNENEAEIYDILKNNYIGYFGDSYFGKSSFIVERTNFQEYEYETLEKYEGVIDTLFMGDYKTKGRSNKNSKFELSYIFENDDTVNTRYERNVSLPIEYEADSKDTIRYSSYIDFVFTNKSVIFENKSETLFQINNNNVIYLF